VNDLSREPLFPALDRGTHVVLRTEPADLSTAHLWCNQLYFLESTNLVKSIRSNQDDAAALHLQRSAPYRVCTREGSPSHFRFRRVQKSHDPRSLLVNFLA
ncbi:unnamed protein product, partial [Ectocarpus sp. 12 AP-2014]